MGDGNADLAGLNFSVAAISVSLGNGDGTFQSAINSSSGGFGSVFDIADYNRDGKLDIATNQGASIDILYGSGDGDNDGDIDIVTASFGYGGTSQLLMNNGDGTYAAPCNL